MAPLKQTNRDIQRLREEYARRAAASQHDIRYRPDNPAYQWMISRRQKQLKDLLSRNGISDLSRLSILEVGCGSGGVMREFLSLGADPARVVGVDLLADRLKAAREQSPALPVACADGQTLPFPDDSFDLAVQFTAFSSILDANIKQNMAAEVMRVLKPAGALIWYDFWWNPLNKQTRGITRAEIKRLFQASRIEGGKITLAPPITRHLIPRMPGLAGFLESLQMFNSHYLFFIGKQP